MGIPEFCTEDEEQAIYELQSKMKNVLPANMYEDEAMLYRFLKARDFNIKKAEVMLTNHLQFRKEIQLDEILELEFPKWFREYFPETFLGYDKEGRPVRYMHIGKMDSVGYLKATNLSYLMTFCFQLLEGDAHLIRKQAKKLNKNFLQCVYIYDVSNLSMALATHKPTVTGFLRGAGYFQDNFPEHIGHIFIINVSPIFLLVWPLIKNGVSQALLDKVHMHGKSGWKKELLKYIDPEILPAFLGGTRTDPDGNTECVTIINNGGKIPKELFTARDFEELKKSRDMKCITVNRQSKITIPIRVDKPMSILHWEYDIKKYDIGFGLSEFVDEELEEIIPVNTFCTDMSMVHTTIGQHKCKKSGKYAVVFDNSYSWLHNKEVCYKLWVTESEEKENKNV